MQPPTDGPRAALATAQVRTLLQESEALTVSGGLEIIDLALNVIEDISDHLAGGQVSRNSYADLHGAASLKVSRELDWGAGLVRPYIVLADGTVTARFNLGVYHTSVPAYSTAESPPMFEIEGYDLLLRLQQPVGDTYAIAAGASYLEVVEQILLAHGLTQYIIDPTSASTVAPTSRVWAMEDTVTWLSIVNDLLASIGYAGIWADWDGRLRCHPYQLPAERAAEWTYTDDQATTMLGVDRQVVHDYFAAPNKWVVYRSNNIDAAAPVDGDGMWTWVNQSVGETSVDARGGLVIPKVVGVDTADQASLIVQAQQIIQADMDIPTVVTVTSAPNPLHWHYDRIYVATADLLADAQVTSWTLPLPPDAGEMTQEWRVIAR
ncbi:hypothetical protein [Actinoplanes rectilineatus]|uniref:hypothetical protein n=1 Tax=Actinoplanes rectilineatus TaxID=113571 RepID=UPI0005F2EAC7|nr:hypothetical protein [Actinoplanes rectilineatus]